MILSAGLSPAWQQILTFEDLTIGKVNRAQQALWCASGKVLNVGRAVWSLGGSGHTLCPAGGITGQAIREEFAAAGLPATWIATSTPTRVCTTLIDRSASDPQITELVENADSITADELVEFERACARLSSTADVLVCTGSLSDVAGVGPPIDLWARLLAGNTVSVILDIRGPELIAALPARPLIVKPNRDELAATVGRSLPQQADVVAAMRELIDAGAQWVLTTDGPQPALLSSGDEIWRLTPPSGNIVNPIGCGDALAAGIAVSLEQSPDVVASVCFGMAAAVVNLGELLPARLRLEEVARTVQDVTVESFTGMD